MRRRNNRKPAKPFKKKEMEIRSSKKWGNSVDEAVNAALADLGVERDDVDVVVLEEPSRGFLGIGSKMALVEVIVKTDSSETTHSRDVKIDDFNVQSKEEESFFGKFGKTGQKREEKDIIKEQPRENRKAKPARDVAEKKYDPIGQGRPADLVEVDQHVAGTFVKSVTDKMGLDLSIKVFKNDDSLYIDITGEDAGSVIGKRGQTLDALQYLTSLVANKEEERYVRVVLDIENYRSKREKTLESLAFRLADKVDRTGKSVRLEPMNPYERKIIHSVLQQHEGVLTGSEGEEPYRRVVIRKKK